MTIIQVVGVTILATILIIVIKQIKPEMAFILSLLTGIIILIIIIDQVAVVIDLLNQLARKSGIDLMYFNTIVKIIGIAYIGQFGAEITKDSGETALASKIEIAAKILIMIMAVPIMLSLIETILEIIPL
ncbi:stage III sporulation protein AD [Iocasia frigidifontis]|uniref:Stage III sporulation protein AD n=1 Tax=Iocasia fonsfrigidae TaxID=2682810 RepID=A0A8A7K9P7_9FIRM|nr:MULTISPECIES: stage III sporulation protein AD [Halanaerobiaceae]AZO95671.1 stage III sporulation protein AD [Halocella sp. SP3-1]QTL98533.1 stage III sporulation protein AD [Iocasia fonsfrigidae]